MTVPCIEANGTIELSHSRHRRWIASRALAMTGRTDCVLGCLKIESATKPTHVVPDKRANGSRECAPDDKLRERDPRSITTDVRVARSWGGSSIYRNQRWLWVPAFAGTTQGGRRAPLVSSFSPCGRRWRGRSPRRMRGLSPWREPLTRLPFAKPPSPTRGEGKGRAAYPARAAFLR
jgi:hypothetical protein